MNRGRDLLRIARKADARPPGGTGPRLGRGHNRRCLLTCQIGAHPVANHRRYSLPYLTYKIAVAMWILVMPGVKVNTEAAAALRINRLCVNYEMAARRGLCRQRCRSSKGIGTRFCG